MRDWGETDLGSLVEIKHGFAFEGQYIRDEPPGDILLTPGNFAVGGGFKGDKFKYYDGPVPEEFVLKEGDLLVTMTDLSKTSDTLGFPALVPPPPESGRRFLHNQRLGKVIVRDPEALDRRFLHYVLCGPEYRNEVLAGATGTTVKHTSPDRIKRFRFSLPPVRTQQAIGSALGTLDDKIELNRRMSETLEAMARALFKSWFVDFEPVRAKAEGRDPGLPGNLADLFPDALTEHPELGEVPEGWSVSSLRSYTDVARGLSYKGSGLSDGGMPMHNLNSIYEGGGYKRDGLKRYSGEYKQNHVARAGDLIVANTEQGHHRLLIGHAAIVPTCFEGDSLFSHHIYRVRVQSDAALTADYLCHLLNTPVMHDIVSGYANGTTVNMLPMDGLQSPLLVVPPPRVVGVFTALAQGARLRGESIIDECRTLAALRAALLPRLITGELRVNDSVPTRRGASSKFAACQYEGP